MEQSTVKRLLWLFAILLGLWAAIEYVLPVALPFLLGALLAYGAEPLVQLAGSRLKLPRPLAAGVGVTLTLLLFGTVICILGAFALRELMALAQDLPDIRQTAADGSQRLEGWLMELSDKTPKSIRPMLTGTVEAAFDDTSALMEQVSHRLTSNLTGTLSRVPRTVLTLATGVLAGFMISGRLPKLKTALSQKIPSKWKQRYIPALKHIKSALFGWLKAQLKLSGVTWLIVGAGFLLLKIPYGLLWAALVALVDAVPVLGTGTVLVPWALVEFLQGRPGRGISLLVIYGIALVTRTVLEPRLVGKQLGLDPLVTLAAFYTGFMLWGIGGMLLAPVLATAVKAAVTTNKN